MKIKIVFRPKQTKGYFMKYFFIFLLLAATLTADDAESIVKRMDDLMRGKTSYSKITMIVTTKRSERKMTMEGWSEGNDKSFIKILYPKKDYGITFLKIDDAMWQYVPKIEKTIKIPPSMMLQSWMGSDFTNDDMVKESSIVEDYDKTIIAQDSESWTIEMIPKPDAAVVWGKIIMKVSKKYEMPLEVNYYDEDDVLERELFYKDFRKLKDRYYPFLWSMFPKNEEKMGNETRIEVETMEFDIPMDKALFTKRALKKYSR